MAALAPERDNRDRAGQIQSVPLSEPFCVARATGRTGHPPYKGVPVVPVSGRGAQGPAPLFDFLPSPALAARCQASDAPGEREFLDALQRATGQAAIDHGEEPQ